TAVFGSGAVAFLALMRSRRPRLPVAFATVAFDTTIVSAYILIYSYEQSTPVRQLIFLPIAEGALLYGIRGSVALALVTAPVIAVFEWLRSRRNAPHSYQVNFVTFQIGVGLLMGLIIGWLVLRLRGERAVAEARAAEAEALRDELGRRADLLEAANRCARALGSSLELEPAFAAFIRELRGLVPFDRTAIVLAEEGAARVIATAGVGQDVFAPGTFR